MPELSLHATNAWACTRFNNLLDECGLFLSDAECQSAVAILDTINIYIYIICICVCPPV